MMQIAFIGIGAGVAAALLFASVTSGSWLSILLFYLAPLPILIAGLGWSHWAALIAALPARSALGCGVRLGVLLCISCRRRRSRLVARLSRHAGAPGTANGAAAAPRSNGIRRAGW